MTISNANLALGAGANQQSFGSALTASDTTPKDIPGTIRFETHPIYGVRGFMYGRFDQSGGATAGQLLQYRGVTITNIDSGTTTSITKASAFTADTLVNGWLFCNDDAGGAGAAPEGESARIIRNTANTIYIDTDDAFTAAPAANDDFTVILPWAFVDSASGTPSGLSAGVPLVDHDQYAYGWVQFSGIAQCDAVAAGTALAANQGVIAGTALVTASSTSSIGLIVGVSVTGLSSDTVRRKALIKLQCGPVGGLAISS